MFTALFSCFKKYGAMIIDTCVERREKCRHTIIGVTISKNKLFQDIAFEEYPTTKSMITKTTCIVITYLKKNI